MTYKNIFLSLIMLVAIGLVGWTTFLSYRPHPTVVADNASSLPDAYMEDVSAVILNKFGKPSMKIVTPRMVHFASHNTTQLIAPHVTLYRKSPQPWYITSNFAKASQGIENVAFWENVTIHHAADQNSPATVIKTPTLMVHPNQQIAETKDLITLIQPNIVVKATGMHADMNTGDIKLISQARGEYAPDS